MVPIHAAVLMCAWVVMTKRRRFPRPLVFATSHGHPEIEGSPFDMSGDTDLPAGLQCEACHGPLGNHGMKILPRGQAREPMLDFAVTKNARPELQNYLCLACHEDYNRMYWQSQSTSVIGFSVCELPRST